MNHPWTLTTPDGLPPALEQAWEAMRARCLEADAMERTLRDLERAAVEGMFIGHDRHGFVCDICENHRGESLSAAVAALAKDDRRREMSGDVRNERWLDVMFDGPPSHESGRFVEVEDEQEHGYGSDDYLPWQQRGDLFFLRFPHPEDVKRLRLDYAAALARVAEVERERDDLRATVNAMAALAGLVQPEPRTYTTAGNAGGDDGTL